MSRHNILCVFGTRPEVIKMAPVIHRFRSDPSVNLTILSVAQHREMLDQMLELFNITPDIDLNIMKPNQTLAEVTASLPVPLDHTLADVQPDIVLAQGDTTTAFMAGLAAFYRKIPYAHVEAGLRSGQKDEPFPEELNRTMITKISTLHFAPTKVAFDNLRRDGIAKDAIHLVGNPVIDALHHILQQNIPLDPRIDPTKKLLLVTAHRRENWDRLSHLCHAIKTLAIQNPHIQIFFPVHLNPTIQHLAHQELSSQPNIFLSDPLPYQQFISLLDHAYLALSDSGGIQEEGPALNTPVLIMRNQTERPEALTAGANQLIGTNPDHIIETTQTLLNNPKAYSAMTHKGSPYGDGKAAIRIAKKTVHFLEN